MIPVEQTIMHDPENGRLGNCFQACIASILEYDINKVPHFLEESNEKDNSFFWMYIAQWFRKKGLFYLSVPENAHGSVWFSTTAGYHVISGLSERGVCHAVVGYAGEMVHDPHPSKSGLVTVDYFGYIGLLDPSKHSAVQPDMLTA